MLGPPSLIPRRSETAMPDRRILVKLRPSSALRAAESRAGLRPLYDTDAGREALLGIGTTPRWFLADLPDSGGEGDGSGWDAAHARVAEQLGVAPSDVVFVEPDVVHRHVPPPPGTEREIGTPFSLGEDCAAQDQEGGGGRAKGPPSVFGWHLEAEFTQLAQARDSVDFPSDGPRVRIAHLDTGYWPTHESTPRHLRVDLARNFVEASDEEGSSGAEDPGRTVRFMDQSGHGTGTLAILAGCAHSGEGNRALGGAPEAEVVPLRIAPRVVLLRTSGFARALDYALRVGCDVASMSMGGLPSRAWREVVDEAYLGGLCVVTAAGNNLAGLPTRNLVYPGRYGRVLAVAGVMANGKPYAFLKKRTMEGNHGPTRHMLRGAMAAYSPNIPWARMGCERLYRLNGAGTSSATPQVAAAAALWLQKYQGDLPRSWERVEAVRYALFESATKLTVSNADRHFGQGILKALDALNVQPRLGLSQTPADRDSFAFLRVLTGLGLDRPTLREEMLNQEILQRWMLNLDLQKLVEDPEGADALTEHALRQVMELLADDGGASGTLRRHMAARWSATTGRSREFVTAEAAPASSGDRRFAGQPEPRDPPARRLRVFAKDPLLANDFGQAGIATATLEIPWEKLARGPVGEYIAVQDVDVDESRLQGVDLDDPRLLAQDGWEPSEGNRHFHAQMVYAVAMKTIEHFELALGRPVLWRHRMKSDPFDVSEYVQHLTIRPHHLKHANAYYSPRDVALLFGYFDAPLDDLGGSVMPGSRIHTCLSHDIVAHETTHASLDGMQRRFMEPTNPDVLAFHEGFSDIVAMLQHFAMPGVLHHEIARSSGNLEAETILGSLAAQFGRATGRGAALREAIGRQDGDRWVRNTPDPTELERRHTPHARGAILVAAVFDAFLAICRARTADLYRIYTGGTGVLGAGAIHPDLVGRLADEAARAARHVLYMCIRALDYLPPVDITFFEYLRALLTADSDAVPLDRFHYRVAFVEAFRSWGIYPVDLRDPSPYTPRTLSVDTLLWKGVDPGSIIGDGELLPLQEAFLGFTTGLKGYADACFYLGDREALFKATRDARRALHQELESALSSSPALAEVLGLEPHVNFEVHELRRAMRVSRAGRHLPQVVVSLTQWVDVPADSKRGVPVHRFHGGSTIVVDLTGPRVAYCIVKRVSSATRRERTAVFLAQNHADPLRRLHLTNSDQPFALLHGLAEDGVS